MIHFLGFISLYSSMIYLNRGDLYRVDTNSIFIISKGPHKSNPIGLEFQVFYLCTILLCGIVLWELSSNSHIHVGDGGCCYAAGRFQKDSSGKSYWVPHDRRLWYAVFIPPDRTLFASMSWHSGRGESRKAESSAWWGAHLGWWPHGSSSWQLPLSINHHGEFGAWRQTSALFLLKI